MTAESMTRGTRIFDVISAGDAYALRALLADDQGAARLRNASGQSPILWAQYNRNRELAEILIAEVKQLDFFEAAAVGRADRVATLLARRPDRIDCVSDDGFTALHLAAYFGHFEVARVLVDMEANPDAVATNGTDMCPVHGAAAHGDIDIVELVLDAGGDPNARQLGGFTALHAAANRDYADLAQVLLKYGADPRLRTNEGHSAVDLASTSVRRVFDEATQMS